MRNTDEQIDISNKAICTTIAKFSSDQRGFLSQSILDKLRTFVEAISVKVYGSSEYSYEIFQNEAKDHVKSIANLRFLSEFHKNLQKTLSHYLPDEENSERLMLKYYEYLLKIKSLLKDNYGFNVLENINNFPIRIDPALKEYHEKIISKINNPSPKRMKSNYSDRYYIKKIKPFFVNEEVYYEVTFTTAIDDVSKFDRVIAFTKLEISPNYSVKLSISHDNIEVLGKNMPIQIIEDWEISIRPCELNHFADLFGDHSKISTGSVEYRELMPFLTKTGLSLTDVISFSDDYYQRFKNKVIENAKVTHLFDILDKSRNLVQNNNSGSNMIKYLLYRLNHKIIKLQYSSETHKNKLSNLNLEWGCIPFDEMPFVTSPLGHNPKIHDLFDCIGIENREHELFARLIKNNTENNGCLYTPVRELEQFEKIDELISIYNSKLYKKHKPYRDLENYKNHIYINGYEQDTFNVIKRLKNLSNSGIKNYSNSVDSWLESKEEVDSEQKKEILKNMFEKSHVALIYGAAGTGKTKLIEHISNFFHESNKLYLANTNPAVNNLKNRISTGNSEFKTITSFLKNSNHDVEFDLLVIDECSTVNNLDMLKVLEKASFKLLVLVGDAFQIESINFGNWFGIADYFIPETSVFELTKPYRTTNNGLLTLWDKVRSIEVDILEHITNNNYSANLDESIFEYSEDDEIILCLNYDGLYGINNINKFLQGNNENQSVQWGVHTYKVGDPILFNESNRFKPLIHNNLKGRIFGIEIFEDKIQFDIEIDKSINELQASMYDLYLLDESDSGKSIIRFFVNKLPSTDEDEDSSKAVVPFQISYAVSIHKAQGLEYSSVKVVITDELEEMVTHNIFYTAITRAKEKLKIYWTPETEKKILSSLKTKFNKKDVHLLKSKFNI